jgi:hypothetical protein
MQTPGAAHRNRIYPNQAPNPVLFACIATSNFRLSGPEKTGQPFLFPATNFLPPNERT